MLVFMLSYKLQTGFYFGVDVLMIFLLMVRKSHSEWFIRLTNGLLLKVGL